MDRNSNNKVYINPNFQRTPLPNAWLFQCPDNKNLSQYCSQRIQNDDRMNRLDLEKIANRKIYVNPNFKQMKQEQKPISTAVKKHEKFENVAYPVLIPRSKYSLVSNLNKKVTESNYVEDRQRRNHSMITMNKMNILQNQNSCTQKVLNNKCPLEVPVLKSRYTIIRKNKALLENREVKQDNYKQDLNPTMVVTDRTLSLEICHSTFNNVAPEQENNILKNKPSENVTKIKISKYKTIPITYLKKNTLSTNDLSTSSTSQSYTKDKFCHNINTYKLTGSSSKFITEGNTAKTIVKTSKKSMWSSQNKSKSLRANFKVNNIPCRLFMKYGKCLRKDYGNCEYVHDKKHVSLCRKFLKGICHDSNCTLSHELSANKMPTCYFYLKGICTKDNCPYLHIKLNDKIQICHNFMRGYCENGSTCQFRHVKVDQSKKSKMFHLSLCNRYKNLPSKSTKIKTAKTKCIIKKKDVIQLNNKNSNEPCDKEEMDIDCRYYKEIVTNEGSCKNIKPSRCKLGNLPSFIQL